MEKNLIRVYTGATSEKRIDIIIKNYTKFIGINTIIVFVMSFQIDTVFYLEQINQRIIVSLIFLTVYFLVTLLFFYISYRIALRKINKLSTDI